MSGPMQDATTGTPFARTLGATRVHDAHTTDGAYDGGLTAQLRLDAPEALRNHLGGPHAAALFGLGETAAATVVLQVFADLVQAGAVPLIKSAEIDYTAVVTGPVTASARFVGDEAAARQSMRDRGRASFPVEVSFASEDGPSGTMLARMALKQP